MLLRSIPYKYINVKVADIALSGGDRSVSYSYPIGSRTKTINAHSLDYDIYLKEQKFVPRNNKGTGVFLDEYLPFHPDYLRMRQKPFSKYEEYYSLLCRFFKYLEDVYGSKIVIAAHPRSNYEDHPDYFDGRRVIKGKTVELVRDAGFVIAHSSTSINFAVLYKKPLLFITTDSLQKSMQGEWIKSMASSLGKKVINISKTTHLDLNSELVIDEKIYETYKNAYIKKNGSEETFFWQIYADEIKTLRCEN